ncbi:hypothetical protein WJX81_004118 [Elliptochloris bilobata]|uniref:Mitochondrial inner membrane protease ATP23 n=1 Tax=Elliptochloris bilobata TaxID=381761 RepID=A0AAW1QDB8_9CHLO
MGEKEEAQSNKRWPAGTTEAECERLVERALLRDPTVKFMVDKLEEAGCSTGRNFFRIEKCSVQVGGGFRPPDGVVICHNHLSSQEEVSHALTHELIHAYDHCRSRDLDWTNCEHHACSEVRSASLSGDCHYKLELARGNWRFKGQHQRCVRRRAELSVAMNPHCSLTAKAAVDSAFERCFADTAPFDRIPP